MKGKSVIYLMDYQELAVLEAILNIKEYWGFKSEKGISEESMHYILFEMCQKQMIYLDNNIIKISDEYSDLLDYINRADKMLRVVYKADYLSDCFCYFKNKVLIMSDSSVKAEQIRLEVIKKDEFQQYLTEMGYLPEQGGSNLMGLEYGLKLELLSNQGAIEKKIIIEEMDKGFLIRRVEEGIDERTGYSPDVFAEYMDSMIGG